MAKMLSADYQHLYIKKSCLELAILSIKNVVLPTPLEPYTSAPLISSIFMVLKKKAFLRR